MGSGYKQILIGIFLITFHINFGPIQIVPPVFGWLFVVLGTTALMDNFPTIPFRNATYLAKALLCYSLVTSAFTFFNPTIFTSNSILMFAPVVYAIFHLVFAYNILEGSILYVKSLGQDDLAKSLISRTGIFIILYMLNALVLCYALAFQGKLVLTFTAIAGVVLNIWFMMMMNALKGLEAVPEGSPTDFSEGLDPGENLEE